MLKMLKKVTIITYVTIFNEFKEEASMTKKEALLKRIHDDLAEFIETEDLTIGHDACFWRCRESIFCPYEINGISKNCKACINHFLEQEEEVGCYGRRIQFIDNSGKLRFILPDKEFIKLISETGEIAVILCEYISKEEASFDGKSMKVRDFIETMDTRGIYFEPVKN